MKALVYFLFFIMLISSCSFTRTTKTPGVDHTPTSHIELLDAVPARPHHQIGTVEGFIGFSYGDMIEKMKTRGRELGADALVFMIKDFNRATALAIKYND